MKPHNYVPGAAKGSSRYAKKVWRRQIRPRLDAVVASEKEYAKLHEELTEASDAGYENLMVRRQEILDWLATERAAVRRAIDDLQRHSKVPMSHFDGYDLIQRVKT